MLLRVENIANESSLEADFSSLRASISNLTEASAALDHEKYHAEKTVRKIIHEIFKEKHKHHHSHKSILHKVHRFLRKIAKKLGFGSCGKRGVRQPEESSGMDANGRMKMREGHALAWIKEHKHKDEAHPHHHAHPHSHHHKGKQDHKHGSKKSKKLFKKLKKAVKHVQAANKKLVSFERGFISEEGLKDREWYKHLGVAPGKWLGKSTSFVSEGAANLTWLA